MDIPLDAIYYINLDNRVDKRQHIETNVIPYFEGTTLQNRIERFSAIRHYNGALGCSLSHLEVARKAKASRARYYMVFEDDFQFLISKEEFRELLEALFSPSSSSLPSQLQSQASPVDFKIVMLAYNALNRATFSSILDRTTNAQTTAGFIVNCTYVDELIACWSNGINKFIETGEHWNWACDQCWKVLQKEKWFITATRVGKQKPAISDIGNHWVNPEF